MKTSDLGGMDSLLSMVQMPSGVPVACVAIGGAKECGDLRNTNPRVLLCRSGAKKIVAFKQQMAEA